MADVDEAHEEDPRRLVANATTVAPLNGRTCGGMCRDAAWSLNLVSGSGTLYTDRRSALEDPFPSRVSPRCRLWLHRRRLRGGELRHRRAGWWRNGRRDLGRGRLVDGRPGGHVERREAPDRRSLHGDVPVCSSWHVHADRHRLVLQRAVSGVMPDRQLLLAHQGHADLRARSHAGMPRLHEGLRLQAPERRLPHGAAG
jgi:hypothetical protein